MSLIVGTNSYVDADYINNYATERGYTLTSSADIVGLKAMDYLNLQNWKGEKTDPEQDLDWPRKNVYVNGKLIDSTVVPNDIKKAQAQLSLEIDQGNDPTAVQSRKVKREKLDTLEVEYADNSSSTFYSPFTSGLLSKYLQSGSMGRGYSFNVVRT